MRVCASDVSWVSWAGFLGFWGGGGFGFPRLVKIRTFAGGLYHASSEMELVVAVPATSVLYR